MASLAAEDMTKSASQGGASLSSTAVATPTMELSAVMESGGSNETTSSHKDVEEQAMKEDDAAPPAPFKPTFGFWMIMLSVAIACFLSALDLTAISTALPTISEELHSENYSWIASSYALSSTAFLPVFGGLAETFGRKPILIAAIAIFAVGSAVCGSAQNVDLMIIGRTIQGTGGGGILALSEITVADLVPLAQRGAYFAALGMVWAISSAIGPIMGGALAETNWRWLFYLNLPISGLAIVLVLFFMNLKIPQGTLKEKLKRIDWIGCVVFIVAATCLILGLTFGGDQFPWRSAATLVPLIAGGLGLIAFVWIEKKFIELPILPFELFNRTSLAGYFATFLHGIVSIAVIYFYPVWFQGVKGQGAVAAGISLFPTAFLIAPMAIAVGVSTTITQQYLPQNILGGIFLTVGTGLLVLLKASSTLTFAHGIQVPAAIGLGMLYASTSFAVLAPLPPSLNAPAMSFHAFTRSFGQVLGIVIGTVAMTNQLAWRMPADFAASLSGGSASAYSAIPKIKDLPEPLRTAVRVALSDSIRYIWFVMIALSGWLLVTTFFMKPMTLNAYTDEKWAMENKNTKAAADLEKSMSR